MQSAIMNVKEAMFTRVVVMIKKREKGIRELFFVANGANFTHGIVSLYIIICCSIRSIFRGISLHIL